MQGIDRLTIIYYLNVIIKQFFFKYKFRNIIGIRTHIERESAPKAQKRSAGVELSGSWRGFKINLNNHILSLFECFNLKIWLKMKLG